MIQSPSGQESSVQGVSEAVRDFAARAGSATTVPSLPTDAQRAEFARLLEEGERVDGKHDSFDAIDLSLLDQLDRLGDPVGEEKATGEPASSEGGQSEGLDSLAKQDASNTNDRAKHPEFDLAAMLFGEDDEEDEE